MLPTTALVSRGKLRVTLLIRWEATRLVSVLERGVAVDGHYQVRFGQRGAQHVHDAVVTAERQAVGIRKTDAYRAVAPIARALMMPAPLRTPESNNTGSPSAASSTPAGSPVRESAVGLSSAMIGAVNPVDANVFGASANLMGYGGCRPACPCS